MIEKEDEFRRGRVSQKGRNNQKFKNTIKKIDTFTLQDDEFEESLFEMEKHQKIYNQRRI